MNSLCPSEEEYVENVQNAIKEHYENIKFFEENNMIDHIKIELQYITNLEELLK